MLSQGLPLALGFLSHALINLVDLAMVGRLGADAVRAAHVATTWNFLPMLVGQCVSTALLSRLSRLLGAGERDAARAFHRSGEWFMLWLGLGVSVLSALPATLMVDATGMTGAARADAVHYLVVANLGCVPMFVLMQTTAAMRAAGEATMPLALLLLANVGNLLLAAVLLYGWDWLGVPSVGVVGAAYAAVAARIVAAALALLWMRRRSHALTLAGPRPGAHPSVARPLVADAWPQVVQIGLRAAMFLVLTAVVQWRFGDDATAAIGITTRFDTLVLFAALGFGNAATVYAAQALARGEVRAARAAGLWAGLQAGLFGSVVVALTIAGSEMLARLFVDAPSPELIAVTKSYFTSGAWAAVLGAAALAAMGAVHGAGRMRPPMVVDLVAFPVALGCLVLAVRMDASLDQVFGALCAGMAAVAALHLTLVRWGPWTGSGRLTP